MYHLLSSFKEHIGERGCHFYDVDDCRFLPWDQVVEFANTFPGEIEDNEFTEKLTNTLANYNPDSEFLAVKQDGTTVAVELYAAFPS